MVSAENGVTKIATCPFCGASYEDGTEPILGSKAKCKADEGGCGAIYKLMLLEKGSIKEE